MIEVILEKYDRGKYNRMLDSFVCLLEICDYEILNKSLNVVICFFSGNFSWLGTGTEQAIMW